MNVALFCVFRNEHIYINEFIEHYLNLGFNHIYLIDNSSNHTNVFIKYAQLNHYITKSTEEYLTKNRHNQWDFYEKYFQINEYTEEKAQMLEELTSS